MEEFSKTVAWRIKSATAFERMDRTVARMGGKQRTEAAQGGNGDAGPHLQAPPSIPDTG